MASYKSRYLAVRKEVYAYIGQLRLYAASGAANIEDCPTAPEPPLHMEVFRSYGAHRRPMASPACIMNGAGCHLLKAGCDTEAETQYEQVTFSQGFVIEASTKEINDLVVLDDKEDLLFDSLLQTALDAQEAASGDHHSHDEDDEEGQRYGRPEDNDIDDSDDDGSDVSGDKEPTEPTEVQAGRPDGPCGQGTKRRLGGGTGPPKDPNRSKRGRKTNEAKAQGMIEQISTALKGDGSQSKEIAEAVNNLSQALISEGTASRAHEMKMHDSEMKMFMDLLTKSNQK